jgi:hypothetical protein
MEMLLVEVVSDIPTTTGNDEKVRSTFGKDSKSRPAYYQMHPSGIRATLWNNSLTLAVALHPRTRFLVCCPPIRRITATLNYGTPKHLSFAVTFFAVASFSPNEMFLYP